MVVSKKMKIAQCRIISQGNLLMWQSGGLSQVNLGDRKLLSKCQGGVSTEKVKLSKRVGCNVTSVHSPQVWSREEKIHFNRRPSKRRHLSRSQISPSLFPRSTPDGNQSLTAHEWNMYLWYFLFTQNLDYVGVIMLLF